MKPTKKVRKGYDKYYELETHSGIIGLMTCFLCGASVIVGGNTDTVGIHNKYHNPLPKRKGKK